MRRRLIRLDPVERRATFRVGGQEAKSRTESIRYERLFPSVPLPKLIGLIGDAPDPVRRAAASLPTTSLICVNLGIGRGDVTEKHWIYYPEDQERYLFQRIFVQSNASPLAAPPGYSALSFEISYSPTKPLPVRGRRALIAACVAGLKRTDLWQDGDEIVFEQVLGLPHAYIPFTPERRGHLDIILKYLHGLSIYPIGRFGEWKYLNQDGAILSAKRVVEALQCGDDARLQWEMR